MTIYVPVTAADPIAAALEEAEKMGYQTDTDGNEYYFESNSGQNTLLQVFTSDAEPILWGSPWVGNVTSANTLEVHFSC